MVEAGSEVVMVCGFVVEFEARREVEEDCFYGLVWCAIRDRVILVLPPASLTVEYVCH